MAGLRIRDTSAAHLGRRRASSGAAECMPTFIIIGAAKAGTTALQMYLGQHPKVYFTHPKEPNFFAFEGEEVRFRGPLADTGINAETVTNLSAYQRLFMEVSGQTALGDASPSYLRFPKAAERIRHYIPEARLVAVLREPVERAYSNFLFARSRFHEPLDSFMHALDAEEARIRDGWEPLYHYARMGLYYEPLARYYDLFPANQIKIYLYEDFKKAPSELVADIFRFVGVDDSFVPDFTDRPFVSGVPKSWALQYLIFGPLRIRPMLSRFVPEATRRRLKERLSSRNLVRPPLPSEARERLRPVFRDNILKLQDLIGRDLSHWLVVST